MKKKIIIISILLIIIGSAAIYDIYCVNPKSKGVATGATTMLILSIAGAIKSFKIANAADYRLWLRHNNPKEYYRLYGENREYLW